MHCFTYLKLGLAVVLGFVGLKMLLLDIVHIPIAVSLGVIAACLAVAAGAEPSRPAGQSRTPPGGGAPTCPRLSPPLIRKRPPPSAAQPRGGVVSARRADAGWAQRCGTGPAGIRLARSLRSGGHRPGSPGHPISTSSADDVHMWVVPNSGPSRRAADT
jgi:hypothetical protein